MPLYEYECESCGHRFEVIQKFSDPPVQACPSCPGTVRRLLSSPAIQFKGSGWYITDYARKGGGTSSGAEEKKPSESKADAGASASGSADAGSSASSSGSGDSAAKKD